MLIAHCETCGLAAYPAPVLCWRCHGNRFDWIPLDTVTVLQTTQSPGQGTCIATVAGDDGPRMVARVPRGTTPGDRLPVVDSDGRAGAFVPPDPRAPA